MKRICVKSKDRKPERIFDLIINNEEQIFVEIKYTGMKNTILVRIDDLINDLKQRK